MTDDAQAIIVAAQRMAQTMTPARQEAYLQGATFATQVLAEVGFTAAVGTTVRELSTSLQQERWRTEQVLRQAQALEIATDALDERARRTVALAASLLKLFKSSLLEHPQTHSSTHDPGVLREIARAVSYALWAYQTGDPTLPKEGPAHADP